MPKFVQSGFPGAGFHRAARPGWLRGGRWLVLAAVLLMLLLALAAACTTPTDSPENPDAEAGPQPIEGLPAEFGRLAEVWELLQEQHVNADGIDPQAVSDGAIRGMLAAIDDPYAAYLDAEQFSLERQDIQGFFEGIGAEVGVRDGMITILAPLPDTPAEMAGIRPGDVILAVDGRDIGGLSLLEVVNLIRGEGGTTVRLLVRHRDAAEAVEIEIRRARIALESVRLIMQVGGIGHLRLTGFTRDTKEELLRALERFRRSRGAGLVVDLRNNPGGLVSSVVEVTSQFIDEGVVLYQIDAQGERRDWDAESGGAALEVPLVVLVNEFSASASEVFAGALADYRRAPIVGMTTFGKGSVNNLWPLSDGSGVNFTVANWFTPGGTLIEGEGIVPEIIIEPSEAADEDRQLDQAIEILQQQLAKGG